MESVQSINFLEHRNADPFNIPLTSNFMGRNKYIFPQTVSLGAWATPLTSINPLKVGIYPTSPEQKYVDPRNVDDYAFPIKDEPSPFSPPLSNHGELSLSISSIANEAVFSDDVVSTREFSPTHPHFNYQFCDATTTVANCYANPYHEAGASTDTHNLIMPPFKLPIAELSSPTGDRLTPPPSPRTRRRGPGRPSKPISTAHVPPPKRPTGHNAVKLRRQMHNDSAMRSRARLNQALEDLWKLVPQDERVCQPEIGEDQREVCRAVKVEVAIGYLKKLKAQLTGGALVEELLD